MTCIAAWTDGKTVWMGADSAASDGGSIIILKDPKIFQSGECLIGFTGPIRLGNLLRYHFKPPKSRKNLDAPSYINRLFVPALRQFLQDRGYLTDDGEIREKGDVLLGYRGEIFQVEFTLSVVQTTDDYYAIGDGASYALGVLAANKSSPEEAIENALRTAQKYCVSVREPFIIERLDNVERSKKRKNINKSRPRKSARRTATHAKTKRR